MNGTKTLDVVTVGRSSVDLYGEQVGGRLEDMASFAKYVGGCPTNIAVGTARLGLRSALITRVGDEHMGRFIKEQCAREGVDVRGIVTDPQRLTALVILGIRDKDTFPLIFYRENCADAALGEADIDEDLVASAKAVVVTGTHFSTATLDAASRKAMRLAKAHGGRVVLDIDYRPVLWGLTGHGLGEERFVARTRWITPPARGCGSAGPWNCRARARCASRAAPTSAAPCANGRPSTAPSAWCSTIRTIRPSCARSRSGRSWCSPTPAGAPVAICCSR